MDRQLFQLLVEIGGLRMPLNRSWNGSDGELRAPTASRRAPVPDSMTARIKGSEACE